MAVRLPEYHVRRPRLTAALTTHRLGVVIAGGGYGKSALAGELADRLGVPAVTATLEPGAGTAESVLARLGASARQQGLSDLALALQPSADDAADSLLRALGGLGGVLVVDEVQHLAADGVALLERVVARLAGDQRLLLVGRSEPAGLGPLRTGDDVTALTTDELALTIPETEQLCAAFGLALVPGELASVHRATAGWAAAVVLLASRARVAGRAPIATGQGAQATLTRLVDEILHALPRREHLALVQLAHLPLLDEELATHATGVPEVLRAARHAGLPLVSAGAGWLKIVGPIGDDLAARAPARPTVLVRAAEEYARRELAGVAAEVLLRGGQPDEAARLLAGLAPAAVERLELATLWRLAERLPDAVVAARPRVLLHVARACEPAAATRRRASTLERAVALADAAGDAPLWREVQAEVARDLARDNGNLAAIALARLVLEQTGPSEELTRARLLDVLGQCAAWQRDDVHLDDAYRRMSSAAHIYRAHEQWSWLAQVMIPLAVWVHSARGEVAEALRRLDDALALQSEPRARRGVILTFRAETLQEFGRHEEAQPNIVEALAIAELLDDVRLRAYAYWCFARSASETGDPDATQRAITAAEANRGEWYDQSGCLFLADAADYLDRVGRIEPARDYLERAKAHPNDDPPALIRAEAALLARHGDPEAAERCIQQMLASAWFQPRDRWQAALLRAHAAMRRGDPAASELAADSFEHAAELGYPNLPLLRERSVTEALLAQVSGSPRLAAVQLDPATLPVVVALLGTFRLTRGGRPIEVPIGQGRRLVQLVACAGGRLLAEAAIEALWPDTDPDAGSNRLRTVLNRLRDAAGDVVVRVDKLLQFAPHVQTDALAFEEQARRALATATSNPKQAVSLARGALAGYPGELLAEEPYEAWTIGPRERLKRRAVALLDMCAAQAVGSGDVDEAVRCLERAIEIVPDEEERYLQVARHLLAQGRRGAARAALARARAMLDDFGLLPPPDLRELEEACRRV